MLNIFLSCRWYAAIPQDQHCLRFTATTSLARGGRFQCKLVGLKQGMTIHDTCVFGFWQVLEQLAETSVTWKPSRGFSSLLSCETKMFLMHTPCVPRQDNGFGEWPVMSKLRIARITSAQGGGTSRRNARQVDPNIIPLADHSPLCWHGLPKHRFRGRNAMIFFSGKCIHAMAGHYMRSKTSTNAEEFQSYVDRGNILSHFISPTSSNHLYHWNLFYLDPTATWYLKV